MKYCSLVSASLENSWTDSAIFFIFHNSPNNVFTKKNNNNWKSFPENWKIWAKLEGFFLWDFCMNLRPLLIIKTMDMGNCFLFCWLWPCNTFQEKWIWANYKKSRKIRTNCKNINFCMHPMLHPSINNRNAISCWFLFFCSVWYASDMKITHWIFENKILKNLQKVFQHKSKQKLNLFLPLCYFANYPTNLVILFQLIYFATTCANVKSEQAFY